MALMAMRPARATVSKAAATQHKSSAAGWWRVCHRRGVVACAGHNWGSGELDPSRHMALPNNAMWLLDFMQDQWYDVRGPDFIIQRAESGLGIEAECVQRLPRKPRHVAPAVKPSTMGLVHRAMRQNPASFMLLEGGVIEVSDFLDACDDAEQEHAASVAPNTSCTGIVRVADSQEEDEVDGEQGVFVTDSNSPRRTKVIAFTCKCCGARNHSRVNPHAFLNGTLVARCASCERWHKLSDHFGLFHDLSGPVFRAKPALSWEDVPESLRGPLDDAGTVSGVEWE